MSKRIEKVQNWLKEQNIEAVFINSKENVFYLSDFLTDPHERLMGLFLFKESDPLFVLPAMEKGQLKNAGWEYEIIGYGDHENPWDFIKTSIERRETGAPEKLAIEKEVLSYSRSEAFLSLFPKAEVINAEDKLNELRVVKDEKEIETIRRAAEMADFGVKTGVEALQEGITEMEVLAKIEYELKKKGFAKCHSPQWSSLVRNPVNPTVILGAAS